MIWPSVVDNDTFKWKTEKNMVSTRTFLSLIYNIGKVIDCLKNPQRSFRNILIDPSISFVKDILRFSSSWPYLFFLFYSSVFMLSSNTLFIFCFNTCFFFSFFQVSNFILNPFETSGHQTVSLYLTLFSINSNEMILWDFLIAFWWNCTTAQLFNSAEGTTWFASQDGRWKYFVYCQEKKTPGLQNSPLYKCAHFDAKNGFFLIDTFVHLIIFDRHRAEVVQVQSVL